MENKSSSPFENMKVRYDSLFEVRVRQDKPEEAIGVKDPNGKFWEFKNGEKFEAHQIEGVFDRARVIVEKDGTKRLFEVWAMNQGE